MRTVLPPCPMRMATARRTPSACSIDQGTNLKKDAPRRSRVGVESLRLRSGCDCPRRFRVGFVRGRFLSYRARPPIAIPVGRRGELRQEEIDEYAHFGG